MTMLKNMLILALTVAASNAIAQAEAEADVETNAEVSGTANTVAATDAIAQPEAEADVETDAEASGEANTFDGLSAGNKTIARALMDAQVLPEGGSGEAWTLDQIAAAKSGTGWGQVFQQMQAEGLITARNLGQVVSSYQNNAGFTTENDGYVTTGTDELVGDGNIVSKSKAAGAVHNTLDATGRVGNLHKQLPVSAHHDITNAAGADITTGLGRSTMHSIGIGGSNSSTTQGSIGGISAGGVSPGGALGVVRGQGRALGLGK